MKRTGWLLVWLALGGAGCFNAPAPREGTKAAQAAPVPPPAPPAVLPDQVTDANAVEQARALRQELEHAAHEPSSPEPAAARP